jgi:carbon storage regulator
MLVLSRKVKERIVIGGDIEVTVIDIRGDRVKLGFTGPPNVPIHREEVYRRIAAWSAEQAADGCGQNDNHVGADI